MLALSLRVLWRSDQTVGRLPCNRERGRKCARNSHSHFRSVMRAVGAAKPAGAGLHGNCQTGLRGQFEYTGINLGPFFKRKRNTR